MNSRVDLIKIEECKVVKNGITIVVIISNAVTKCEIKMKIFNITVIEVMAINKCIYQYDAVCYTRIKIVKNESCGGNSNGSK